MLSVSGVTCWWPVAVKSRRQRWSRSSCWSQSQDGAAAGSSTVPTTGRNCRWGFQWKIASLPSSPNQTKLLKKMRGKNKRGGEKEAWDLHIWHLDVGAKHEQAGSCVGHECINKSFLTCETQPWKVFFSNVFLFLSSACGLSAQVLILSGC